jgi:hypothetical protein
MQILPLNDKEDDGKAETSDGRNSSGLVILGFRKL